MPMERLGQRVKQRVQRQLDAVPLETEMPANIEKRANTLVGRLEEKTRGSKWNEHDFVRVASEMLYASILESEISQ